MKPEPDDPMIVCIELVDEISVRHTALLVGELVPVLLETMSGGLVGRASAQFVRLPRFEPCHG